MMEWKATIAELLGMRRPGRDVHVFDDDTFLVSYPRSGNTWLRFMLASVLSRGPVDFRSIERIIPDIYQNKPGYLRRIARPRVLKSHEYFDPRYPRIVYLIRDPRDVCVSYYHYHRKKHWLQDDISLDAFVPLFLKPGLRGGFGTWAENLGSWLGARGRSERFLLIKYEDLSASTISELTRITEFLELNVSGIDLQNVVDHSSADTMRELEQEQSQMWSTTRDSDASIPFIRKAKVAGWQEELSAEASGLIERAWNSWMREYGYLG